jgi:ABC-type Fe3+/spermidine/putrescine transport system ATPase subunit
MTHLQLTGLTHHYPGAATPVLQDLDLTVRAGRMTALLGPSGSGKSTLLRLVAGLLHLTRGKIALGGQSILHLPPERRRAVMVFQDPLLFPHLTVAENVGFGLRMRGLAPAEITKRSGAMLEEVQLSHLGTRRPAQLSGGQAQRVALARALVLHPDLLLLDEPLSSLDAGLREEMRALVRQLQQRLNQTTLIVTHDQAEAVVLADDIALILDGRVVQHAEPAEMFRRPASLAVARFFGGANFLPGQGANGGFLSALGHHALPAGLPDDRRSGPGILTIRPEALRLGPGPGAYPATVLARTFLGSQSRIHLGLGETELVALCDPARGESLAPGTAIGVTLTTDALWVLPDEPPRT